MRHTTDGALDRCPPVVALASCLGSPLTQQRDLHLTKAHVQRPPTTAFHRTSRTPCGEGTGLATSLLKVGHEAVCFATRLDLRSLPPWASHGRRRTIPSISQENVSSPKRSGAGRRPRMFVGICSTCSCRKVSSASGPLYPPSVHRASRSVRAFRSGSPSTTNCSSSVVLGAPAPGDQLHLILRIAGFGQVGHITLMALAPLHAVGRFPVVGRLQTAGAQLVACFHSDPGLSASCPATREKCSSKTRCNIW